MSQLKPVIRQILKDRQTTLLHLTGLSLGLGVCLLIALWIRDESAYDRFHSKSDRIYRALWAARFGDNEWKIAQCPMPLATLLGSEFPEVERATQCAPGGMTFKKGPDFVRESDGLLVDEQFAAIFDLDYVEGNPTTVLQSPEEIVLTESMARRYFGNSPALGQTLTRNDGKNFRVSGIVRDWPKQSHLKVNFLTTLKGNPRLESRRDDWSSATVLTYFLLKNPADIGAVDAKMKKYVADKLMVGDVAQGSNYTSFPFQPLTDIHLHSAEFETAGRGNIRYVWIFGIVALAILALGCINFINLATARALTRAREVGVRKVLGSTRGQLIWRFMAESAVMVIGSVVVALAWVVLAIPAFQKLTGKEMSPESLFSPAALALLAGLTLLTTLAAGLVPAFFLSKLAPARALKSQSSPHSSSKNRLRQALVVAQFCVSTAMIIGALVVQQQLQFLQNRQLGFQKEQVLVLKRVNGLDSKFGVFFERIRTLAGVEAATAGQFLPGKEFDSTIFLPEQPSNYKETSLTYSFVDGQFVDALGLELKSGHNFRPGLVSDSAGCLINEACARRLGWAAPLGKTLTMGGWPEGKVLGVVADFHFQSLHHEVEPIVLKLSPFPLSYAAIRLRPGNDMSAQLADIQSVWKELAPTLPFDYSFLDEDFQKQYEAETRLSRLFGLFSTLAIVIACLGLFGLATFTTRQRTKEIGIRKTLGASVFSISNLIIRDFLNLVVVAIIIASPIAFYAMQNWLSDFAYRIDLEWWMFASAGAVAIAVALLTVGFQSVKAALVNPVRSLRSE
jgi:putative ABC transport system permease protein